jgi:hypothetical protein
MHIAEIKEVCKHVRARGPAEWDEFVRMFAEYTAEAVDAVTEAPAADIMETKGFARANKAWLKIFTSLDTPAPPQQNPLTPF